MDVAEYRANARAASTRRAYGVEWGQFAAWCEGEGVMALPASGETLAEWLASRARAGIAFATISKGRAAVSAVHREAGESDPGRERCVRELVSGMARVMGRMQSHAPAMDEASFHVMLAGAQADAQDGATPAVRRRGRRDGALLAVMRDALLRRSEAAALDWRDVYLESDWGALTVRRSKSDPHGQGVTLYLGPESTRLLLAWGPGEAGSVFGLCDRQVCRVIEKRAREAGLTGRYSGHSPRVGMALDLVREGEGVPAVQQAGRWRSPAMVARYARAELTRDGAVARYHRRRKANE